jgi:hypothetical protein
MSKMQRDKGAQAERDVARILMPVWKARRRASGEESQKDRGRDLEDTPGYCVQVQCAARPTPEKKLEEAARAKKPGEVAVAATRRSSRKGSGPWLATLLLEDLSRLLLIERVYQETLERERERLRLASEGHGLAKEGKCILCRLSEAEPEMCGERTDSPVKLVCYLEKGHALPHLGRPPK